MLKLTVKRFSLVIMMGVVGLLSVLGASSPAQSQEGGIQLPDDYVSELIYRPPLAGLGRIVRSEDGLVFINHLNPSGGTRVSMLDVDQDQATTIYDLPPSEEPWHIIIGGPEDTFFIDVGGEIRQVNPDGSFSVWGRHGNNIPWYYTPNGRMLGIAYGETGVVELFPDGSTMNLVTGLSIAYDVVADDTGNIFISDFMAEILIQLDPDGLQTTIASIPPDNTDLTLDGDGNLYVNSGPTGFVRVDKSTGTFTPMTLENAPCYIVQSPADVVFDDSGHTIFASWGISRLTWADFSTNTGGELLHQPWANSFATAIGPDDAFYIGVNGCGTTIPSEIVRFTIDGDSEVYLGGLNGFITDIAFDSNGGLYVGLTTETSARIHYYAPGSTVPLSISVPLGYDIWSMATDPVDDCLFVIVSSVSGSPTEASATIFKFTTQGFQESYSVSLPKPVAEILLGADPEGALYAFATERERLETGPEVDRWILRLDLIGGTSEIIAQINRIGCCPFGNFSVDSEGNIWWVLNPEFVLYKVLPPDTVELFAYNLPVDSGSVHRNSDGDLILNTPEGIFRIWKPTPGLQHGLTISSTAGGSVTDPSEGTFTYDQRTVVNLVAEPEEGYQFVEWTGDVDTIADVDAASTTITMEGNYEITASFEEAGGCFIATVAYGTPMAEEIQMLREFRDEYLLTNPVGKGLVEFYYMVSPPMAEFIAEHPNLKLIVRAGLVPVVAMCSIVFDIVPQFTGSEA